MPLDELNTLVAALKGNSSWMAFNAEIFSTTDDCMPNAEELERADFVIAENFMARTGALWNESTAISNQLIINPPAPEPLKYCPAHFQSASEGAWAIDVDIERRLDYSLVSNVQQKWQLPRRLRITRALISGYQIAGNNSAFMMPRVAQGGLLTLYANVSTPPILVKLPDDEDAIAIAFLHGHDWWPFVRTAGEQMADGFQDRVLLHRQHKRLRRGVGRNDIFPAAMFFEADRDMHGDGAIVICGAALLVTMQLNAA